MELEALNECFLCIYELFIRNARNLLFLVKLVHKVHNKHNKSIDVAPKNY